MRSLFVLVLALAQSPNEGDVFKPVQPVQLMAGQEARISPTNILWPMHIDLMVVGTVLVKEHPPGKDSQMYVAGRYKTGQALRHAWLPTPHEGSVFGRVSRDGSFVRLVMVRDRIGGMQNGGAPFFGVTVLEGKVVRKDGILFLDAKHDEKVEAKLQEGIEKAIKAQLE